MNALPFHDLDVDASLRTILEGTATETGERFFAALVENLARALNTHGAWVTEYLAESAAIRALAFWMGGQWIHELEPASRGSLGRRNQPARLVHIPDRSPGLLPNDPDMRTIGARQLHGCAALDLDGKILGHLAVLDMRPMPKEPRALAYFKFLPRAQQPSCVAYVRKSKCANAKKNSAAWLTAPWTRSLSWIAILMLPESMPRQKRCLAAARERSWASPSRVSSLRFA